MRIVFLMFLIVLGINFSVQTQNKCNQCNQLKSQRDCEQEQSVNGTCKWIMASQQKAGYCQLDSNPMTFKYTTFCGRVDNPDINCSKTVGCAYVDNKCTHFTGCQAYVKKTTQECQSISQLCISDGNACINAKECKEYTEYQCESSPSISGIGKCKFDMHYKVCRDLLCSEADKSQNIDEKCKECSDAPNDLVSDYDCQVYKKGCITTGKGCVLGTSKPLCSTYSGDNTTCVGYIGSDGVCEGDAGRIKCRAKICENAEYKTNELCQQYKSSCKTNGRTCVSLLSPCNTYQGTTTTCALYIGTDGYCQGTSLIFWDSCLPKACEEAPDTTITDNDCNKYQINCVTTGIGCVKKDKLKSCTTYEGDNYSCYSRVGVEGKCMWKSGNKCVARNCESAPINFNTNLLCANYFTNCVTNGYGCIAQTSCILTVKQQSCQGTNKCTWQSICTSNANCGEFKKKSSCLANSARVRTFDKYDERGNPLYIYVTKQCFWKYTCKEIECSDLTGIFYNNDANCATQLSTCISNRVDACITKYECGKLTGTQSICLSYQGYCTNISTATDATPCEQRKCSDNTEAIDNATCALFLPGCISNGKGCVDYTTSCTSMRGTQETCNKLFAFKQGPSIDNFTTHQCYNSLNATKNDYCKVKTCKEAEKQDDSSCKSFFDGCVYNGNGGCVDPKDEDTTCGSYTGDASFCESAMEEIVSNIVLEHLHKLHALLELECETFMLGCIAKSEGGCISQSKRSCSQQQGTITTCPNFSGGLFVTYQTKVVCTKHDSCQDRLCSDIVNPKSAQDCLDYKSTCRFYQKGFACIDQAHCGSYNFPESAITDQQKFDYCTNIKDYNGILCGYTLGETRCSERMCDQFLSTYTSQLTCTTYLQKNISTITDNKCKLAGIICYLPERSNCTYRYSITDMTDILKLKQCRLFVNDRGHACTFQTGDTKCSLQDSCEKLIIQTDERNCNDQTLFVSAGKCQKVANSICLTLSSVCSDYKINPSLTTAEKFQLCWELKVIDNLAKITTGTAFYTKCAYKSGSQCDAISKCSDIYKASSQQECQAYLPGCLYYSGKCYSAVSSGNCPTTFPIGIITDTQKSLYCRSIKEVYNYCQLSSNKNYCENAYNPDCGSISIIILTTSSWDAFSDSTSEAFKSAYCLAQSTKDRTKFCKYTAGNSATSCSDATCDDIPSPTNQGDCDNYISGCIYYNYKCYAPGRGLVTAASDCADNTRVPMDARLTGEQKLAYCQSYYKLDKSFYCTYDQFKADGTPTQCTAAETCTNYTTLPANYYDRQIYCLSKINQTGQRCAFTQFENRCRDFDCLDIQNPTSQIICNLGAPGRQCVYLLGTCYNKEVVCTSINAQQGIEKVYCDQVSAATMCTYISGSTCAIKQDCHLYSVNINQATICATLTDASENRCTYLAGNNCVKLDACSTYDGSTIEEKGPIAGLEEEQCKAIKSFNLYPCIKDTAKKCRQQVCTDNDASAKDCMKNANGCLYYYNKCISQDSCGNYKAQGDNEATKQKWCEGILNSNGDFCVWDYIYQQCRDRQCSDKSYYTDFDCQSYLKTCKTNGTKCIPLNSACSQNQGSTDFCKALLDSTGKDRCRSIATATTIVSACTMRTCYDNVTATTDYKCNTYLSGCVTRGTGCIPNTEPCTSYRGTKQQCELFKKTIEQYDRINPTYEYCSGNAKNTTTSKCRVRICIDNTTATSDAECDTYLKGCITNGIGCIDAISPCTAFRGDQAICSKFMGSSGKDYCWNTKNSSLQSDCSKKQCRDIFGKNNQECNEGMPPLKTTDDPFCIFYGTSCIEFGKYCNAFNGTEETCPTYLAQDGPCKATTIGNIQGVCAKRVCTEALNTLQTDIDCQKYHKDCYSTGYGCTSINYQCSNIITKQLCQAKPECSWVKQCTDSITKCETLNHTSYSQCVNSQVNGKFCFWIEHNSTCISQTCENQPATLDTHSLCQNFADNCTTTGSGCITISVCTAYIYQSICEAASYSKDGLKRCIWDSILNSCRNQVCSDISAQNNSDCDAVKLGCKQMDKNVSLDSHAQNLQINYFVLNQKMDHVFGCEDAINKTFFGCQLFSPLCTTNGDKCIPITSCGNTQLKVSCIIGTDGQCGWLPSGKCQRFGYCTDAVATTNDECYSYGPSCITDGETCITRSICVNYDTQKACNNLGTDGTCFWNKTTNTCKQKECSDELYTTYNDCKFTGISCTTNGVHCIPLSTCQSYVEAGCHYGTGGECIFALPVGATIGKKTCRLKQCEDISSGTSNANCQGVIFGKHCVSNGTSCIPKAACSSYHTITACNGGGLYNSINVGGQVILTSCAFTRSDIYKTQGTCKEFTACSDAINDPVACLLNPSCKLIRYSTTTRCINHTCETYATKTECRSIPSFKGDQTTICLMQNGICTPTDPITITDPRICYIKSAYTHSWNILTNKCESCGIRENNTSDDPDNQNTSNQINYSCFLSLCLWSLLSSL